MAVLSWFGKVSSPKSCFISHAYADSGIVDEVVKRLPRRFTPVIFPPINVLRHERVSDDLVKAILKCDGLIYVSSINSLASVWVNCERDYALRAGKIVFAYQMDAGTFARDHSMAQAIPLFVSYSRRDSVIVSSIAEFMKKERRDVIEMYMPTNAPPNLNWNRVDDLIVRIYAMSYRRTRALSR